MRPSCACASSCREKREASLRQESVATVAKRRKPELASLPAAPAKANVYLWPTPPQPGQQVSHKRAGAAGPLPLAWLCLFGFGWVVLYDFGSHGMTVGAACRNGSRSDWSILLCRQVLVHLSAHLPDGPYLCKPHLCTAMTAAPHALLSVWATDSLRFTLLTQLWSALLHRRPTLHTTLSSFFV
jgi:hypothetical protein